MFHRICDGRGPSCGAIRGVLLDNVLAKAVNLVIQHANNTPFVTQLEMNGIKIGRRGFES